ncbi:MAG: CpaF family protein [Emergencia timonensis]|uniref:CpaF family protein n=1 Tax=Emergencia timonensis TaxID=1776384 RepID=UPI00295B3D20|nr:ATPase, T2SS/T4P/T4SS family [Emergencia timonensis]WNX90443.1 ATPase, T2SS/T4P/T4SS family [Emergencia timonensis]
MLQTNKEILEEQIQCVKDKILALNDNLQTLEAMELIEDTVLDDDYDLELQEYEELIKKVYAKTRSKLGMLEPYINDESINEIMVNGKDHFFFEDSDGIGFVFDCFDSTEELEEIIRNIAAGVHREINEMNPILDARLADGSRVNAVYKNVAVDGPVLTIRKFSKDRITIDEMVGHGTLTRECADFLKTLVECGYNIFVSGGTSSGKTTFLNALSDYIPQEERVIVIEDSTELQLERIENLVQMECHNANTMGQGQISMDMLIKTSLRMRPDRIIVGEVRGREVADMLQAMNTGHDGSMSTGRGNSVAGMLRRLEAMYLMSAQIPMDAIRAQIVEGIDIMVHLGRLENGNRRVIEVQELLDFENGKYVLNPLFALDGDMELVSTGNRIRSRGKLLLKGMDDDCRL